MVHIQKNKLKKKTKHHQHHHQQTKLTDTENKIGIARDEGLEWAKW